MTHSASSSDRRPDPSPDPIWLQNFEMELGLAATIAEDRTYTAGPNALPPFAPGDQWRYNRAAVTLAILLGYVESVQRWLDEELVAGTDRVRRVYVAYQGYGDWRALEGAEVGRLQPVVRLVKRLKGLQAEAA